MKHLIVVAHPNPKSLTSAYVQAIVETSQDAGHEVRLRDLYALGFQPVLGASDFAEFHQGKVPADIAEEQGHIAWADMITFVYPTWWAGMPAMLKGYVDRVFSYGFAYSVAADGSYQQLLKGKKAMLFTNNGTPDAIYEQMGMLDALRLTSDTGVFRFCGVEVVAHKFFGGVAGTTDEVREDYIAQVRQTVAQGLQD